MIAGERPSPADVLPVLFDNQRKLLPAVKREVVAQVRCRRRMHLVAFVILTAHGPLGAWRTPTGERHEQRGKWEGAWLDRPLRERVWCTDCRQSWSADLIWLSRQSGTVLTDRLTRWTREAADDVP